MIVAFIFWILNFNFLFCRCRRFNMDFQHLQNTVVTWKLILTSILLFSSYDNTTAAGYRALLSRSKKTQWSPVHSSRTSSSISSMDPNGGNVSDLEGGDGASADGKRLVVPHGSR